MTTNTGSTPQGSRFFRRTDGNGIRRLLIVLFFSAGSAFGEGAVKPKVILPDFHADPSAHAWAGRYWIYPSTDEPGSTSWRQMKSWNCYSSTDLVNWERHGEIFSLDKISWAKNAAWAPDCMERNGKYYFYFPAALQIGVAVSDNPDGPFEDALGKPLITAEEAAGCQTRAIDPNIFIDDDGRAYLFFSGGEHVGVVELNEDMVSKRGPVQKLALEHCAEGIWVHKRNGIYYFSYPRQVRAAGKLIQDLVYSTSTNILGPYDYRGTILATGGRNVHHSTMQVGEQWYLFYHVEGPSPYERRVCAEYLYHDDDGSIRPIAMTGEGIAPLHREMNPGN